MVFFFRTLERMGISYSKIATMICNKYVIWFKIELGGVYKCTRTQNSFLLDFYY